MIAFAGTWQLVRLNLRRDRIMLPLWLVALVLTLYSSVAGTAALYPTEQGRAEAAAAINSNPAVVALYGPATDLQSLGGLATWKPNTFLAILIALMSTLVVVRHTRADEESGRLELLGAGVVGRHAALTAALVVAFGANVLTALLMMVSITGQGLPGDGVVVLSLGFAAIGCVFAAVAAVAAQLTESARTATGITATALAGAFLLRAAGDSSAATWLSWLSPIGWAQKAHPFGELRWWPLLLPLGLVALATVVAYAFAARRDLAAGLLPPRPGPAQGSLRTPLALAWRLHRGQLLGWSVGFAVLGGVLGSIASTVGQVIGDQGGPLRDFLERLGGGQTLVDAYIGTSMGIAGVVATAYAVQAALRLRAEENAQRVESLLATRVGRIPWALSHVAMAVLGPVVLLGVAGLTAGLAHGAQQGDLGGQLPRVFGAALVQLPAVWVVVGITLALFGLAPRYATAGWGALVVFLLVGELGPSFNLSQLALDVSPYTHVPKLPYADLAPLPLLVLTAIALVLTMAGLAGFRRRDVG